MSITFTFPNNRQNFQVCDGIQSIKAELSKEAELFPLWKNKFRVEQRKNGKYIYVKCKQCSACMRYKWKQEEVIYRLVHYSNQHHHHQVQNVNNDLERFIQDLPLSIQLATARKIATGKLGISASKFYHAYSKLRKTTSTIAQLIKELERRDFDISLDPFPLPEGEIPRIIVVISPKMKDIFRLYGQTVSYDLTYNLIQEISPQRRQYAVGIFTGVNCFNKIIPLGVTVTCEQTTEAFCKIFQSFIQCCGSPKSFITDEQIGMKSALDRLKQIGIFKGAHLIDSFHAMRNFAKVSLRKDLLKQVSEIIQAENHILFEFKLEEFKKQLNTEQQLNAFKLFYAKRHQLCFSQIPKESFLIFNASNSINQKMNDLVKTRIRSQKQYSQVLRTLVEFTQNLIQTSQESIQLFDQRIEDIFKDPELRLCRYLLAKRPMQQFLHQYVESLSLREPSKYGDIFIFQESYTSFECLYSDHFDCSCDYTSKTGIGCRHMIWICRRQKLGYMNTIHARWKFDKKPAIVKQRRFNRSTRRK